MPKPFKYVGKHRTAWRVRFRAGGRQRCETFYAKAEADKFCRTIEALGSERALADLLAEDDLLDIPTLDQWAERHFASLTNVTEGTRARYRRIYASAWAPQLGHYRLHELTRENISAALLDVPGADKTVRNAWGILAAMLKVAATDQIIPRSPAVGIKLPRRTEHERTEHRYLTHAELARLHDAMPEHWRPLLLTLAGTGIRWGEAEALTVADVTLGASPAIRVNKAVKWDPSKSVREVGPTKTRRSRRTVTLPPEVAEALEPLVDGRKGTERLFVAPRGGPVRHRTFYSDVWVPTCKRAGLEPRPRIHDLRHSHVAWLVAAGIPLPAIQARLGHESIQTSIDVYGHLLPDLQRAAATAAGSVFGGTVRGELTT